jgi:hypothetical protein
LPCCHEHLGGGRITVRLHKMMRTGDSACTETVDRSLTGVTEPNRPESLHSDVPEQGLASISARISTGPDQARLGWSESPPPLVSRGAVNTLVTDLDDSVTLTQSHIVRLAR